VGTIRIEPTAAEPPQPSGDDSTLELLFEAFAQSGILAEGGQPLRLVAASRFSRGASPAGTQASVRADLARLLEDLQAEYDELSWRLCP
jgi:hypothetical protein